MSDLFGNHIVGFSTRWLIWYVKLKYLRGQIRLPSGMFLGQIIIFYISRGTELHGFSTTENTALRFELT